VNAVETKEHENAKRRTVSIEQRRRTIWGFTSAAAILSLGLFLGGRNVTRAGDARGKSGLALTSCETWTPDPHATPVTCQRGDGEVQIAGNGTQTCCGGWQFCYSGVREGQAYRLRTRVEHQGLENARDSLVAIVMWDHWDRGDAQSKSKPWNYLLPKPVSPHALEFEAVGVAPPGTTTMTVRYTLRWTEHGSSTWSAPQIEQTTLPPRKPVKVCVLSQTRRLRERIKIQPFSQGLDLPRDVASAVDGWASLVEAACRRKPQLIVTPELAISGTSLVEGSVAVPGPATRPFERLAREHQVHVVLGIKERSGEAVYNSAALVGPEGKLLGIYRKVHLATSEGLSGLSPGNGFPVFDTCIGRVGCMICMDTTLSESARTLALGGADFICFPIMGDLRADRWSPGTPIFSEDRWKAIMRTRAMDNQVCMVVARNDVQGSCIIDRKGDILAWNEGDQEIIEATVPPDDGYRIWDGGDFREVTFLLRRPHLYGAYTDQSSLKPLDRPGVPPAGENGHSP
jgi:predicted amidohydrolase